jgi:DNA-binding NarL/FixJ family response regulator
MDVIVTDLSMPDVDGVTLLEFVRERYPLCFRIIHSSQVGTTLDVDVSELAHRVLPKPAQIDALLDAVDAAVGRMPRRNGGSATSAGA